MRIHLMACCVVLAGCSKGIPPAEQPPVDLQTGLYEITVGGGTIVEGENGKRTYRRCLAADAAFGFPHDPLTIATKSWDGCADGADPKGNALKGERTCLDRKTPVRVAYEGSHDDKSFVFEGTVAQGSDENASVMHLGSGDFRVSGTRVGDCY